MKRLNQLPERDFLKLFFAAFSLSFLLAAFVMPDRADMLPGLWRILSSPRVRTLQPLGYISIAQILCHRSVTFARGNRIRCCSGKEGST